MNPYPGLRPFQESEAHLFFGRAAQTDELLGELERSRFVAVLGSSGSGKSSLVKAGLLPALHGGFSRRVGSHWQIATLRPGGNPIHNLARALAAPEVLGGEESDPLIGAAQIEATLRRSGLGLADAARAAPRLRGGRLLVVVDQFEELFRFQAADTGAQGDAAAFVALLIEATGDDDAPVDVILTMRSDFLGDCSQFRDLPETINRGLYLVPRLTRSQLREAITAPAAVGGGAIAPRLVQRLLNDAGANPDLLPVLQHALMRTWDLWAEGDVAAGPVDLEHYEAAGGLEQALARHADEAYDELADDRQRRIAELMFKRLTELGPDRREVRRPCPLDEIAAVAEATPDEVREVIGHFERGGRSFVTVSLDDVADLSDDVVDISHESLIRQWPRLRAWVAEEAESRKVYLRLTSAAERWQRGEAALLRDPDLQVATRWWTDNHPNKAWADRYDPAFERATGFLERSRRAAKRRRIQAVAGVASLALVACAFAILAILAVRARNDARDQQQVARSISLATRASEVFGADPELGLILALRASDASATPQAQEALRQVTNDVRLRRAVQVDDNGVVRAVVFSPDGTRLVTAGDNGRVAAWDPETGGSLGVLVEKGPRLNDVALSPDGAILATADTRGVVRVRDAGDGRVVATLPANPRAGRSPARRPARGVNAVAFGPGGRLVATAGANGQVVLWDWRRDQILGRLGELDGPKVWRVAFSPDGRTLAAAFDDGRIRLWDTSTRAPLKLAAGPHTGPALAVAFSPDGQRLASGGEDGTVRVYDLPGGRRARLFRNQRGFVNDVAFSTGS